MIRVEKIYTMQDMKAAFAIREEVFVREQNVPLNEEYDQYEKASHHYLATCNGTPCGAARWRTTTNGVKLERFAVLASYRNKQIGSHILKQVLQDVKENHPELEVYLHAQLPAIPFYARHGFSKVGEQFSECDIEHFKMIWNG